MRDLAGTMTEYLEIKGVKMRVILVQPPQPLSLDDRLDIPYSLMCLASVLLEEGIDTEIVDLASVPEEQWPMLIKESDIYGLIVYTASYNICKRIARICKEKNAQAKVIVGGPHPTALPEETLRENEFDVVVKGEGDRIIVDVIKDFPYGPQFYQAVIEPNIDSYPLPRLDLIDFSTYHRKLQGKQTMTVFASRGCSYNCRFCCKEVFGASVRFRSIEKIIKEIELGKKYTDAFVFWDDVFGLNRKWLNDFCREVAPLKISFRCNGRAGFSTVEDFEILKEAGCKEICFGLESGSQKILNLMNKRVTVEDNYKAIEDSQRAGLTNKAYLMIGFPGETQETVDETRRFIDNADPDQYSLFTACAFPGSDLFKNPGKYGITKLSTNWDDYYCLAGQGDGGITFDCESYTKDELIKWREQLKRSLEIRMYRGGTQDYEKKVGWR